MSTSPSRQDDHGIPNTDNSSPLKEFFINEDYGTIKTHILRRLIYQEPQYNIFTDKKYIISDVISFNLNKDYHFINNEKTPCIYFNQISQHKVNNNNDLLFLNTMLSLLHYKSQSLDVNDRFKCLIETLFNKNLEVSGYRFWYFYFTVTDKDENVLETTFKDNMIKRKKELLQKNKKFDAEFRRQTLTKKGKSEQAIPTSNLSLKKKIFEYLTNTDNNTIFKLIRDYLHWDKNCNQKINFINHGFSSNDDNDNNNSSSNKKFNDNLLDELESNFDNDSSKFLNILSKESTMTYFINNIHEKQTNLSNYFNNNTKSIKVPTNKLDNLSKSNDEDDDNESKDESSDNDVDYSGVERLNNLRKKNIKNIFKSFPFPNTVYEINTDVLLPEIFYGLPLPHSININLSHKKIINKEDCIRKDLEVVGLHDTYIIPELPEFYELLNDVLPTPDIEDIKKSVKKYIEDSTQFDSHLYYRLSCIKKYGQTIFRMFDSNLKSELTKLMREKLTNTSIFDLNNNNQSKSGFSDPKIVFINEKIQKEIEDKRDRNLGYINDAEDNEPPPKETEQQQQPAEELEDPLDKIDSKTDFFNYCNTRHPVTLKNILEQNPTSSWWAKILEKYTPIGLNFNNLDELQKYSTSIPRKFIKFDFALRLQILNNIRWDKLKANFKFRDNKDSQHYIQYPEEYRKVQDAMAAECFYYFFTSDKTLMSEAHIGIRDWILLNQNGFRIADPKWKMNLRPFGQFLTWVVDFLNSVGQISHNLKIALLLYFCKFHHTRYFSIANIKERNKVKLNVLLLGDGMSGKSHVFKVIQYTIAAFDKCVRDILHSTAGCNNVDGNYDGFLRIHDEFNSRLWMEGGNDPEVREQLKNIMSNHKSETLALVMEKRLDEDGNSYTERAQVSYQASNQMILFCATNNNSSLADANVLTRFLVVRVPKTRKEADEANANHFKYNVTYNDLKYDDRLYKQQQILHATVVLMEKMIQAGVYEDYNYGVEISGGESAFEHILDAVHRTSGINTADHRKRVHQIEVARSMAIAYACWMGMVSPFTQYLFNHNDKYIGFNHRILTMGIMPWSVVTSDQVAATTQLLNFNFQETFLEEILEIFALKICKVLNTDDNSSCFYTHPKELKTEYSYIYYRSSSLTDLARAIQSHMKYKTLSTQDIESILIGLTKRYKSSYTYTKKDKKETYLYLDRENKTDIPITDTRPIMKIDKIGRDKVLVFLSVSFLKETFPTIFNNTFIESDKDNLLATNTINNVNNNDNDTSDNLIKELDLESCFTLNTNINPFAVAFKNYYETKYLGHIDQYFTHYEKKEYAEKYTVHHNNKKKLAPLRYVTPEPPRDYLLSYSKLPHGLTNVVKLDKVLSIIELDLLNTNPGVIEYNLQTYLPSEVLGIKSINYIQLTDGNYEIMKMDQTILDNNINFIHEQKCDHDYKSCSLLLKRIHFPGYITLDNNKCINWPLMTYHELMNDFLDENRPIINRLEDKYLYPEINVDDLVKNKNLLITTRLKQIESINDKTIVGDDVNKSKRSILKFSNTINQKFASKPPQEIISHELLKRKLADEKRKEIEQRNLKKQMETYANSFTQKTSATTNKNKKRARGSDETPKSPKKLKK